MRKYLPWSTSACLGHHRSWCTWSDISTGVLVAAYRLGAVYQVNAETQPDIRDCAPRNRLTRAIMATVRIRRAVDAVVIDKSPRPRLRTSAREAKGRQNRVWAYSGQVGHLVGKPQSFISKIESGERGVGFIEMQVFTRVYGKPLSYFEDKAEAP